MKQSILLLGILGCAACCMKHDPHKPVGNEHDRAFVQKASYANIAEVDAGKLAAERGNDASSWFGLMMQTDHGLAQEELKNIAAVQGFPVPSMTDSVHQNEQLYLMSLSGRAFDSAYAHIQVKGHADAIALFRQEIDHGHNEPVRNYARKYLPKIEMHKHAIDSIVAVY